MPSLLAIFAVVGVFALVLILVFMIQVTVASRLIVGTLSEPIPMRCNVTSQWLVYECRLNPITGLGCVVPNSQGRYITAKNIAVESPSCLPEPDSDTYPGQRVISFAWAETRPLGPCISSAAAAASCCSYNEQCSQSAEYLCVATGAGEGGENQCLPAFLPVPYPEFNNKTHDYTREPITLSIPCRENYCIS